MTQGKAKVKRMEEAFWELPPGHFQAFSKLLVHPANADARRFDMPVVEPGRSAKD